MANVINEKGSDNGSYPKPGRRDDVAYALDERRRAALREVDEAEFSYVLQFFPSTP